MYFSQSRFDASQRALSLRQERDAQRAAPVHEPHPLEALVLQLYDAHRRELLRYAIWMGVAVADAEDTIQEAFIRLHAHVSLGKDSLNLRAWLFRVVHNLAISSSRGGAHLALQLTEEEWGQISATARDGSPNPESALLAKEERARVASRVKSLPPAQMHCLQLRMEGFRYQQIAEILGVTVQTVATNIRRSVEKMSEKDHG